MKKVFKILGIGLGSLLVLLLISLAAVYGFSEARLRQQFQVSGAALTIPTDPAQVERGRHLATAVSKCTECHGEDLGGTVFIDGQPMARLIASNLTRGQGGVLASYSDPQLEAAIRHGVRPNGRGLLFMPSQEFQYLSDEDVAAIIAYLRSVPPVDRQLGGSSVGPIGRVLLLTGAMPLLPAELIDHDAARRPVPPAGPTREYGQYQVRVGGCFGCHMENLGGSPAGHGGPPPPNLTPGGRLGQWTEADFFRAMRTGVRPDGTQIDPAMPWRAVGRLTDDELRAIWLYLRSVPPVRSEAAS